MSRPGLGASKPPPAPNDYIHQAMQPQPQPQPHPFETAPRWEIKGAPKTQEELEGKPTGYTFKDGTVVTRSPVSPEPPRVVITDESDKGPDQAKKPTSWIPDQKVAYGPIGGGLALLIATVSARLGYEMTPLEAIVYATALIGLAQFLLPKKDGS